MTGADDKAQVAGLTAIVILNYNGRAHLERYLPSLYALLEAEPQALLYVADNGSEDESEAFLRAEGFELQLKDKTFSAEQRRRLIKLPQNYGFAQGYNLALQQIEAEYYWILNSDVAVEPDSLQALRACLAREPEVWACQPKILSDAQPEQFEYAGAAGGWIDILGYPFCRGRIFETVENDTGQYEEEADIFWASGAALFIRAERFHALQGFDPEFFAHMEEVDLCWRIKRLGGRVLYCPNSRVRHLGGGTLQMGHPRKTYLNFRNSLICLLRNHEGGGLFLLVFIRLLLDGVAGLRFLFKGQLAHIGAIVKAHWHFFAKVPGIWQQRRAFLAWRQRFRPQTQFKAQGQYRGSIVWAYYLRGKKRFGDLGLIPKS